MQLGYSAPDRSGPNGNDYLGGLSTGQGWEIRWKGPYSNGPTAIEAVQAVLHHLTHLQRTNMASTQNAKLIVHLVKAIEECEGRPASMGGELNSLLPDLGSVNKD